MTLRDYFAGQALYEYVRAVEVLDSYDEIAKICYKMADAMLKERER